MYKRPEIWGGIEATVNRVGDQFFDQVHLSGHDRRLEDLDRIAQLGLKTIRYPVVWERMAPDKPEVIDWTWADERLHRAAALGIEVIAGLVHHGSGPAYTSLMDPLFPEKLAFFAGKVAERYPWIKRFTPINEPLTTARFSGLYGHWYPHVMHNPSFLTMLLNECRGTLLAMQSIRRVTPTAQLIQTEDMGRIFSTPFLSYEAEFENERRWLSLDILAGRLGPGHSLWDWCLEYGVTEKDVAVFQEEPCVPDLIGINHYVTSNRFLDERLERYPLCYHGSNDLHRYADIEAVAVGAENLVGPGELLREAWKRYGIPVAITEAHLGSSRDEQLRWIHEFWNVACELAKEGVDVRAVTVWALLGSYDWNCLVTQLNGFYEPGAFDLRALHPRPTAIAGMIQTLASGKEFDHPVLDVPGWWHRPDRLRFAPVSLSQSHKPVTDILHASSRKGQPRELLITGSPGSLAHAFAYICDRRGLPFRLVSRKDLDITDEAAVNRVLRELRPWAVINAAGYSQIDEAEKNFEQCQRDNVIGPTILSQNCAEQGVRFLTFSSHLVFDGRQTVPYAESSAVGPLSVFGQAKARAETNVLDRLDEALVVRAGEFFGPWDQNNFLASCMKRICQGRTVTVTSDITNSLSYLPDLVDASLDLLIDGEKGIWHLANEGWTSQADLVYMAAKKCRYDTGQINSLRSEEVQFLAPRPSFGALRSERAQLLPSLEYAIDRFVKECRVLVGPRTFHAAATPHFLGNAGEVDRE